MSHLKIYFMLADRSFRSLSGIGLCHRIAEKEHADLDEVFRMFSHDSYCRFTELVGSGEIHIVSSILTSTFPDQAQDKMILGGEGDVVDLCRGKPISVQIELRPNNLAGHPLVAREVEALMSL